MDSVQQNYTCIVFKNIVLMKEERYVPNINFVLHYFKKVNKQKCLFYRNAGLGISFMLMRTPHLTTIQVIKNLCICGNFQQDTKWISKVNHSRISIGCIWRLIEIHCGWRHLPNHNSLSCFCHNLDKRLWSVKLVMPFPFPLCY